MSHSRDYSEEIASAIDEEVRRLIESAHDEAWEVLVQYRDVLDNLVLQLMEHETLSREQVLQIFSPVRQRPIRGSYTGYGKRLPSDRPPVLTPKEMALTAADGSDQKSNGQALGASDASALAPGDPFGPVGAIGPVDQRGPADQRGPGDGYGATGPEDAEPGGRGVGGTGPGGNL
jgi:cell division protease FtsH